MSDTENGAGSILEEPHGDSSSSQHNIKKPNKLITLTDKSAAGWDLVIEYLLDELAGSSEAGRKAHSTRRA